MAKWDPDFESLPNFHELPKIPGAPDHASWFWGPDDELGRLNLLTPRRVAEAAKLIKTGERTCLNLPMEWPEPPFFGRPAFKHTLLKVRPYAFDDLWELNTQSGSQWDGFRHAAIKHKDGYIWYNNTRVEQIEDDSGRIGTSAWACRGIVGRGVLLDFYEFCGKSYDPFSTRKITAEEIKACAKAQGVEFKYGDIFIVRTGFSEAYRKLNKKEREEMSATAYLDLKFAGLSRAQEMVELLHDNYFSAVASDAPSFETWPMDEPDHLHYWLLPLWGSPIGELWNLDELAAMCKERNRYTFFLSSSPSNVKGGVGSHSNVVAIF